jgi:hypothetical protein
MLTHVVHIITTILQYIKVPLHLTEQCFPNIPLHRLVSPHYKNGASSGTPFLFIRVEKEYISVSPAPVPVVGLMER